MYKKKLSLREKFYLLIGVLLLVTIAGGIITIWFTFKSSELFHRVMFDLDAFHIAGELERNIINQKGLVSYYFLDNNPKWLEELTKFRGAFSKTLDDAKKSVFDSEVRNILTQIEYEYGEYVNSKDRVIAYYKSGEREKGLQFHKNERWRFYNVLGLCSQYRQHYTRIISDEFIKAEHELKQLRIITSIAIGTVLILTATLISILITQLLRPIKLMAMRVNRSKGTGTSYNEVITLRDNVEELLEEKEETQKELEKSREKLFQSEKMALIGKLAAEVAHSIRNPMTAIKMRLFSLERSLDLAPAQKEDLEVILLEMKHLDNVVRNFLEFSRPPKLKKHPLNISEVVDAVLTLLQKRLELHNITVRRDARQKLPEISADSELLKEAMVNLIVNACDAMPQGGTLNIMEDIAAADFLGEAVMVKISDEGTGIPPHLINKIWEPFFSTKEDGTGLGLPIAKRIINEHGGKITINSIEGKGTEFIIILPLSED